jgi:galactokinase
MKLFVPGRICLFGEHSDWAGGYRRVNNRIEKGHAILMGTNQGCYAEVEPCDGMLVFNATLSDGSKKEPLSLPLDPDVLHENASSGGFYSYVAGTAYQVLKRNQVGGVKIDNYHTDLPVKKGLSSSAAICVLVARSFNRVYNLGLNIHEEMDLAYEGEIMTGSQCGRLDQGCAYGNRPIEMIFDGDDVTVRELSAGSEFFYIIVDLKAGKDTREILARLNDCYPSATNQIQRNVQTYLGEMNKRIVHEAVQTLQSVSAEHLGQLMKEAQTNIDRYLRPACPGQLAAPILHRLLEYAPILPLIYGGKGVGSQGDGSAQLLAKDRECQKKAIQIIEHDLGMECLELVISV